MHSVPRDVTLPSLDKDNRQAVHRSHAASEDEILKDLDKLGKRLFSIEKTVGMRTPAGVWNPNPVAHPSDRASGSVVDANFRELNLKIGEVLREHETFAKWASESIDGVKEEHTRLVNRVSRLQSGRGSQEVDRPSGHDSPQDWHEAIDEINRKMQDLARGIQRQRRDHDDIISRFETVKSHVEQFEARSAIVNRVVDGIQGQIRNLPASSDQVQPAVRRELGTFRSSLEGVMRRVSAIDSSVRNLGAAHNRIMAQLFEMEGQFDEAAGMLQGVQQINEAPQQPRDRRNLGYNAFAGQGHRIRSPTPTPGEGDGRGTGRPVRPGGGGDLPDRALPNVPDRVDPSRADRHPIHPVRERSDSRSRRVRGLPDRSHSPPERARGVPRARARGDVSISPDRDAGRNRSPRPAAVPDRGSEVRNRQLRGERPIRDSGSVSPNFDRPIRDSGDVSPNPGRYSGGGGDNRVHANIQSPGDEWRTPGSRASADTQSPGDRRRTSGAPSDRGQASAPAARGAPGSGGPDAPKICALDDPNERRHPDAEFSCVTCNREFCGLCRGDDGDCCNCHFLKMKCWACRKNAQEVSMYLCTDCGTHVCENHSYFGSDGLERCARCNIRHERAQAGPPPPPPPGGGGGQGGPPGQGESGSGGHGHAPLPPPGPGHPGGGQGPAGPSGGPSGGAPTGGYPGGAPGFSGSAADAHGTGNNQCGSSFYGPAYGGGVSHQGIGAGVSQHSNATGYPSSVASGSNLGPGLSLGYSVSGAGRQGDGGLLPEALRGDDGRDRCTKCNRIPEPGFPLVPCVGCGMRACEVCCPMPARLCESCRITSCTPIGALISTVVDKDRFHHKCNTIVLPAEPTADKLREWLSEIKERVRNAFSFDSDYALAWISETERLDYDALGGPCKYPILDSNFTSAIRECIKTRAVRDKMNRLTEAAQNMNPPQGIKGRQILKLLLNHLQTGVEDDQTFKIAELTSLKCRQTGHSDDEARLRSYLSTWDNLISGIRSMMGYYWLCSLRTFVIYAVCGLTLRGGIAM